MTIGLPTPPSFHGVVGRAAVVVLVAGAAAMAHSWNTAVTTTPKEPSIVIRPETNPAPPNSDHADAGAPTGDDGVTDADTDAVATSSDSAQIDAQARDPGERPQPVADLPWYYVGTEEALGYFETGEAMFVDARHSNEFRAGHILGAFYLPASDINKSAGDVFFNEIMPDQLVVIYCGGGQCDASQNTANRLNAAGYTNYRIYHEGYEAWVAAGGPVNEGPDVYGALTE